MEDHFQNKMREIREKIGQIRFEEAVDRNLSGVGGVIGALLLNLIAGCWYSGTVVLLGVCAPNTPFEANTLWLVAGTVYVTAMARVSVSVSAETPNSNKMGVGGWSLIWIVLFLPLAGAACLWAEQMTHETILIIAMTVVIASYFSFVSLLVMRSILSGYARKRWYGRRIREQKDLLASVKEDLDRWMKIRAVESDNTPRRGQEDRYTLN